MNQNISHQTEPPKILNQPKQPYSEIYDDRVIVYDSEGIVRVVMGASTAIMKGNPNASN